MTNTLKLYAAIRKTDGREWIDYQTLGASPACSQVAAEQFELSLLGGRNSIWAKKNPVVRVSSIQLTESE